MASAPGQNTTRRDWRWLYLTPCATFLVVLLVGMALGPILFLEHVPNFGAITIVNESAKTRPAVGHELAARQQMVTTTLLLLAAAVVLATLALRTVRAIWKEIDSDDSKTEADRTDLVLGLGVVVVGVAGIALQASLGADYCGDTESHHLYRCLGKGIVPDLILVYLTNMGVQTVQLKMLFDHSIDATNIAVVLAGAFLLLALLLLPRGFDRTVDKSAPDTIGAGELKRWLETRLRSLNGLSMLTALVLVAGIAQMFGWMNWPLSIMTEDLLVGVDENGAATLREGYQALVNSVLQFHAVWFGLLVVALIFPTNMLLFYKCRVVADEIVTRNTAIITGAAQPGDADQAAEAIEAAKAEITAAEEIIAQNNAESSFKGYFDSYRGYLLALAPAAAQQLLTLGV